MKYLITGGAGAIGSSIANELSLNKSNRIDIIDNLDSGFKDNLTTSENISFFEGSITDLDFMKQFEKRHYDYIFHLAASFANQNSIEQPRRDLQVNIEGTLNTLLLSQKQHNLKKYLYFSSSCIYGANNKPMKESDIPNPDTPYAISKLAGEYYTNFFHEFYKVPTNILRLFNIYGSNERPGRYRNVIPNFMNLAISDIDLIITGSGSDSRDFTYIDDAMNMIFNIAYDRENSGEIYNVGNGVPTKIGELAKIIIEKTKSKSKIIYGPRREWDKIARRLANTTKVSPYKTTHTHISDGIPKVISFIKELSLSDTNKDSV